MGSQDDGQAAAAATTEAAVKRSTSPGVRVVGRRIYDSENGTTCHQCRQKTRDLVAGCKNMKKDRQCTLKFCHKCLQNRYGENAEEVAGLVAWHCPKCRDICNCSLCMKRKGHKPTGILVHTAKATGFNSVSQTLEIQGPENSSLTRDATGKLISPKKILTKDEDEAAVALNILGKEDGFGETSGASSDSKVFPTSSKGKYKKVVPKDKSEKSGIPRNVPGGNPKEVICKSTSNLDVKEKNKRKRGDKCSKIIGVVVHDKHVLDTDMMKHEDNKGHPDITLPQGTKITNVVSVDLPSEDVGNALQFLEFCATFGEILGLMKGQPECIIRDIFGGRGSRRGKYSSVVQFHIQLLTLLQQDMGEESPSLSAAEGNNSWLNALKTFLSESECHLKDTVERIVECNDGYGMLDCSQKLKLLTFLCDEVLGTMKLSSWIEDQDSKFAEKQKEAKEELAAAKEKEKIVKQKLQDEIAKALLRKNGTALTISEHESIVSKIKAEASKAYADMTEARDLVPKRKQRADAVRTEPILRDAEGWLCWRLKGYGNSQMVLQVCASKDPASPSENWFSFDAEEEKLIKYLPLFRLDKLEKLLAYVKSTIAMN